jgi:hypothetical protein
VDDRSSEMTMAQGVSEILRDHVTLEVEGIDRTYLDAVVPMPQVVGRGPSPPGERPLSPSRELR